jgi:hypothetical protein
MYETIWHCEHFFSFHFYDSNQWTTRVAMKIGQRWIVNMHTQTYMKYCLCNYKHGDNAELWGYVYAKFDVDRTGSEIVIALQN